MEFYTRSHKPTYVVGVLISAVILLSTNGVESKKIANDFDYPAISCREHTASLLDFGGVGDGKTLNTKAFQDAINHLSQFSTKGGALLIVPPGKYLTGSFNLTSHFTLYLQKGAVLLATQDIKQWTPIAPLPSYGRGRDTEGGRYMSLIFGYNLTDVVITGANGTIDGQGAPWWQKFKAKELTITRPYLIEIMHSNQVQISHITLMNSPSWHVHPVYCSDVIVEGLTIIAPVEVPNTDGINPDSCVNTRIIDNYIVSGDDCIAVKSGWDHFGYEYAKPNKQLYIRKLTCISPKSAVIAIGSEMSGGIEDIRAEDIIAINCESAVRIKSAVGRGGYVRNIFVRRVTMKTMKYVFWMTGNYGDHPDNKTDLKALPVIENINYRDWVAENVTMAGRIEGIEGDVFKGICLSNVTLQLAKKPKEVQWNCTNVAGVSSAVIPKPCNLLADQGPKAAPCAFPEEKYPIEDVKLNMCSCKNVKTN